jgi:hypothetical protein
MTKLPLPAFRPDYNNPTVSYFTEAQMLQFRRDALEEAADTLEHGFVDDEGHHIEYAAEIRKLKDET